MKTGQMTFRFSFTAQNNRTNHSEFVYYLWKTPNLLFLLNERYQIFLNIDPFEFSKPKTDYRKKKKISIRFGNFVCFVFKSTLIFPSWLPDANISESRLNAKAKTASSIIINLSSAWNLRSFRSFPVVKFQTSIIPSIEPVTKYWPSGENRAHSTWALAPNWKHNQVESSKPLFSLTRWFTFITRLSWLGYFSSSCSRTCAFPRNKSIDVPWRKLIQNIFFNKNKTKEENLEAKVLGVVAILTLGQATLEDVTVEQR